MRPLLAAIISLALIFGSAWYIRFAKRTKPPVFDFNEQLVDREYWLQLSRTFDCGGDVDFDVESLVVRFRGETLINRMDNVTKEERIDIRPLPRVQAGRNEVYIMANPKTAGNDEDWLDGGFDTESFGDESLEGGSLEGGSDFNDGRAAADGASDSEASFRALRVQVFSGNTMIADETLWQTAGASSISGRIEFDAGQVAGGDELSDKTDTENQE